jgi:hypothetical protein
MEENSCKPRHLADNVPYFAQKKWQSLHRKYVHNVSQKIDCALLERTDFAQTVQSKELSDLYFGKND